MTSKAKFALIAVEDVDCARHKMREPRSVFVLFCFILVVSRQSGAVFCVRVGGQDVL